jgi:hypothetical protein
MKRISLLIATALVASTVIFFACQKEVKQSTSSSNISNAAGAGKGKGVTTTCGTNSYVVTTNTFSGLRQGLTCTNYAGTATTFEWTITYQSGTQAASHFNIILPDCIDFLNIKSVYTVDNTTGVITCLDVAKFTYQVDPSGGACTKQATLKYDVGSTSGQTTYGIVLAGTYPLDPVQQTAYIKSGSKTGCCPVSYYGVGCPNNDQFYCNISHGYWFDKPQTVWCQSIALGNYSYDQSTAKTVFQTSNAGGISATKRAFFQYAAIDLDILCSGVTVDQATLDAMNTIVSILGNTQLTASNIQNANPLYDAQLTAAAATIDNWITSHEAANCGQ